TNSPVTSSGTLTASFISQVANTFFAGPSSGSDASPTFRSLVSADIPPINVATSGANGGITGLIANSNIANPSMNIDGTLCTLGADCAPAGPGSIDILSTQKPSGLMFFYPGLEYYMTTAGVPVTIFQATGSGYISNIFIASANISNYQNSVVSCSVNGEATPSFQGTL